MQTTVECMYYSINQSNNSCNKIRLDPDSQPNDNFYRIDSASQPKSSSDNTNSKFSISIHDTVREEKNRGKKHWWLYGFNCTSYWNLVPVPIKLVPSYDNLKNDYQANIPHCFVGADGKLL